MTHSSSSSGASETIQATLPAEIKASDVQNDSENWHPDGRVYTKKKISLQERQARQTSE